MIFAGSNGRRSSPSWLPSSHDFSPWVRSDTVQFYNFTINSIFRFLLCDRQESRFGERAAKALLSPIFWAKPTSFSVPTTTVANAMIADLWRKPAKNVEIIGNAGIHEMAKNVQEAKGK